MKANALKRLIIFIVAELVAVAGAVWFFDPFYQYHEPFFGWEAVLNDRDNQMPGTIRNFQYDSVLAGSSVAENFDSAFLDEAYDCRTLKVIRASGSMADLLYYLEIAHYSPEINRYMLERMAAGEDRVTEENWGRIMNQMRDMVEWIVREGIYSYYGQMAMKGHMGSLNRILAGS